jgi:Zn-dependent peptidase ImmA (M78 family)/transcriptional regulator with XRE-family HTH domain
MFNPTRLEIARKRRCLKAKELAEAAGVSSVTVTRLENGENDPDERTIERFAAVLKYPRSFFYQSEGEILDRDQVSFRSLTGMSAKQRDSAISAGSLAFLVSDWVDERFNLPTCDLIDFGKEPDPAVSARTLRQHWGLGEKPISNMLKLLEAKGIRVFSLAEQNRNVDAFSYWRDGRPFVFLNTFKTAEHSRFDAAHELGHLVMHRHGHAKGREAETEANIFASHFLIPDADLVSHVPVFYNLDQLVKAKTRWGVSVSALGYRLHKTGIITDWQYRSFCIQVNRLYGKTEPNGLQRETSVVWDKVFKELWKDGVSRDRLARDIGIPEDELSNLVFGLLGDAGSVIEKSELTSLRLV